MCPDLAKTWFNLANWTYKWGRKCLDSQTDAIMLSESEIGEIDLLLPSGKMIVFRVSLLVF